MTTFIEKITSEDTGGGCIVDFVHLKDGRILGITAESVCLYNNLDEVWECSSEDIPTISLLGDAQ
jgi:hypothetical protein